VEITVPVRTGLKQIVVILLVISKERCKKIDEVLSLIEWIETG
jgi:hypothetical protein